LWALSYDALRWDAKENGRKPSYVWKRKIPAYSESSGIRDMRKK